MIAHPATGESVLGLVTAGRIKLVNLAPGPRSRQPSATAGSGRRSKGTPSSSGPMTPSRGLILKVYGSSVERSSPLRAASMTTGTSTTESWPKNAGPPCSSGRTGSTATDGRWTAEHTRLRRGACIPAELILDG